ncbi:MAG: FtsQ-type POTRA domain-containing protein [Firmicutes bacterium]|nr:FtsQ-type POTRA domain-containing protein [Bacillota bacterium]
MQRRIISIVITILVLAVFSFLNSSFFLAEELEWEGVKYLNIHQLSARTSFVPQNVFRVDQTALVKQVSEHIWVKSADVRWRWPNRLIVNVVERNPIAMVPIDDSWFLLDDEGVLLPFTTAFAEYSLPLITKVELNDSDTFETIARFLSSIPLGLYEYLSEWNAQEQILVTRDGTQVLFGDLRDLNVKFMTLELILGDLASRNATARRIDLRVLNSPVIVE